MSEEFLGVIIKSAQDDIRKAGPFAALPALLARLGPAVASKLPSLASPTLDAAALVAAPFTSGMSTAALAGARGLRAGQLSSKAGVARAGAKEAGEAAAKTGEEAVANYVNAGEKTKGGLPDMRTRTARIGREMETKNYFDDLGNKVGRSSPTTLESFEPGGSGAAHRELSQQANALQAEADTLSQQARDAAAGTVLPAAGTVAVLGQNRMQRNRMEAERQKEEAMDTHKRGTAAASTTTGLSNLGSPSPQIQGF